MTRLTLPGPASTDPSQGGSGPAGTQPFLPIWRQAWIPVRDGNPSARVLYRRHYSCRAYGDGRAPALFVGPGQKLVLLTPDARALFVWRKFMSMDEQTGVNCAVFRNEGRNRSSELIRAAMPWAWRRWPGERLYTYVDPRRIRSANPGYCFLMAGWHRCGISKDRGLVILEHAG